MRLEIRDAVTGDQIVTVQGLVDGDIENSASIVAVADAKEYFDRFDLSLGIDALQAILKSNAYNESNSLGRASKRWHWKTNRYRHLNQMNYIKF